MGDGPEDLEAIDDDDVCALSSRFIFVVQNDDDRASRLILSRSFSAIFYFFRYKYLSFFQFLFMYLEFLSNNTLYFVDANNYRNQSDSIVQPAPFAFTCFHMSIFIRSAIIVRNHLNASHYISCFCDCNRVTLSLDMRQQTKGHKTKESSKIVE